MVITCFRALTINQTRYGPFTPHQIIIIIIIIIVIIIIIIIIIIVIIIIIIIMIMIIIMIVSCFFFNFTVNIIIKNAQKVRTILNKLD